MRSVASIQVSAASVNDPFAFGASEYCPEGVVDAPVRDGQEHFLVELSVWPATIFQKFPKFGWRPDDAFVKWIDYCPLAVKLEGYEKMARNSGHMRSSLTAREVHVQNT